MFCTLITLKSDHARKEICAYYEQLTKWLPKKMADFAYPISDFGEFTATKEEIAELPVASSKQIYYFVSPKLPGWSMMGCQCSSDNYVYIAPMLQALSLLHSQGISCHHLSPWSVLTKIKSSQPRISLLNVGIIAFEHRDFLLSPYSAPELSLGKADLRADIYSLGATFYYFLTGKLPTRDLAGQEEILRQTQLPEIVVDFLVRCLQHDPAERFADTVQASATLAAIFPDSNRGSVRRFLLHNKPAADSIIEEFQHNIGEFASSTNRALPAIAYFLWGEPGQGKSEYLQRATSFALQKNLQVMSLVLGPKSSLLLTPLSDWLPASTIKLEKPTATSNGFFHALSVEESYLHTITCSAHKIFNSSKLPLLLIIDNLEWAGEEFLDIIEYLLAVCSTSNVDKTIPPLFILGAGNLRPQSLLGKFVDKLRQRFSEAIHIRTLTEQYTTENIVASALGVTNAPKIFAQHLSKATDHNFLHTKIILATLIAEGMLYLDEDEWYMAAKSIEDIDISNSLSHSVHKYLQTLSTYQQRFLQVLTILGIPTKLSFLCSILQLDNPNMISEIWQLYQSGIIDIDPKWRIFVRSATLWQILTEAFANDDTAFSIASGDQHEDYFPLAYLGCQQAEFSNTQVYLPLIAQLLFKFGFVKVMHQWLDRYLQIFASLISANPQATFCVAEIAFLLRKYSLAMQYFSLIKKDPTAVLSRLRLAEIALCEQNLELANEHLRAVKVLTKDKEYHRAYYYYLNGLWKFLSREFGDGIHSFSKSLSIIASRFRQNINVDERESLLFLHHQILSSQFLEHSFQAHKWLQAGIEIAQSMNFLPILMDLARLKATYHFYLGNYGDSLENFQKSLELAQKLCYPIEEVQVLLEMSNTYLHLGLYPKASSTLKCALVICGNHCLEQWQGYNYLLYGRLLFCQKEYEEANKWYRKSLPLLKDRCQLHYCIALCYLSELCINTQKNKAIAYLEEATSIKKQLLLPHLQMQVDILKAKICNIGGENSQKVIKFLDKSIKLAEKFNYREYLWQIFYQRGCAFRIGGELENALKDFEFAGETIQQIASAMTGELREAYLGRPQSKTIFEMLSLLTTRFPGNELEEFSTNLNMVDTQMKSPSSRLQKIVDDYQKEVEATSVNNLREENEKLRTLLEINKKLNCEHRLQNLLDLIMDTAIELTNAERGFLILASTQQEKLFEVARNFEREAIANPQFEISHSITEKVINTGLPILATDALEDERFDGYRSVSELQLHSVLAIPLMVKERVIGALYIDNRFEKAVFSEREKLLLEAFSDQAAIAIENARLLEANLQKQEELKKSERRIKGLNKELAAANAKLVKKVESQKEELQNVKNILSHTHNELGNNCQYANIIGKSAAIRDIFKILTRIADKNIPVFIHGESGTGKELVAKAIHFTSSRKQQSFLSENCASFTDTLLSSELFGHVKGAFTHAHADKKGLFELAHQGTLFLDEVGDMSDGMQASLLRVLESNLIRRVGGKDKIPVDVRIICASNKDLKKLVNQKKFRQDLFFRLNVVQINLPPLRQRKEDIPLLIDHFLQKFAQETSTGVRSIDKKALQLLVGYNWPGNVRELHNVLYSALSLHDEQELNSSHFRELLDSPAQKVDLFREELSIDEYAKRFVLTHQAKYNDSQLAKILGFSRKTLWEKRKKWSAFRS